METDRGEYKSEDISDNDSILADSKYEDLDMLDVTTSFGPELEKFAQAESGLSKVQITSEPEQAEWASSMQLIILPSECCKDHRRRFESQQWQAQCAKEDEKKFQG